MTYYPQPPWHMHGDGWISVFRLADDADERHPAGNYGVGFIDYREPSPLSYGELFTAQYLKGPVTVVDMWVDSPDSVAGGRTLWGFPKELAAFTYDSRRRGPLTSTSWAATVDGQPAVNARFADVSRAALRVPMKGLAKQPGIDDHPEPCRCVMAGSAKPLPCRARWEFVYDGPLAWLRDARQLGSFAMRDFRLAFE